MSAHRLHRERVAKAYELHCQGLSPLSVAAEMGCTPRQAARWVEEALASLPEQSVEALRATSEVRLDAAARVFGELLASDDVNVRLRAAQGLAGVERDRSKLLGTWQKPPVEEVV